MVAKSQMPTYAEAEGVVADRDDGIPDGGGVEAESVAEPHVGELQDVLGG
jgi:hypothetical protein